MLLVSILAIVLNMQAFFLSAVWYIRMFTLILSNLILVMCGLYMKTQGEKYGRK
jgi:hypothetical protein